MMSHHYYTLEYLLLEEIHQLEELLKAFYYLDQTDFEQFDSFLLFKASSCGLDFTKCRDIHILSIITFVVAFYMKIKC